MPPQAQAPTDACKEPPCWPPSPPASDSPTTKMILVFFSFSVGEKRGAEFSHSLGKQHLGRDRPGPGPLKPGASEGLGRPPSQPLPVGGWATAGHLWPYSLPCCGSFSRSRPPWFPFCCVPYPFPPRPRACPWPAFPGRYKRGVGNHNIRLPGKPAAVGTKNPCPEWEVRGCSRLSPALRTQQDHSLTRRRETEACSKGARPRTGSWALFPGGPAFPSSRGRRRSSLRNLGKGVPGPLWLSVPPH